MIEWVTEVQYKALLRPKVHFVESLPCFLTCSFGSTSCLQRMNLGISGANSHVRDGESQIFQDAQRLTQRLGAKAEGTSANFHSRVPLKLGPNDVEELKNLLRCPPSDDSSCGPESLERPRIFQ